MKKLVVLLLAFAVAGAAFAQTPALTGSATLSWGVDFDTGYTGFKNASSATVTVPFAIANTTKKGETGWWGEIAVTNVTFKLIDNALADDAFTQIDDTTDKDADDVEDVAALSAKITNGIWALSVSTKNSLDYSNADQLKDGEVNVALEADKYGTTLSYASGALSFGVTAVSKEDWLLNTKNEYAIGANVGYKVSDALSVKGAVAYDLIETDHDFGATASATYSAAPLTVTVASDMNYVTAFDFDVYGKVAYAVMEGLDAKVEGFFSTGDDDLEGKATVEYAVDPVEAKVWFGLYNPLHTMLYDFGISGGYTYAVDATTSLKVSLAYTNDFTGKGELVPYAKLTNTAIANTTLTLEYNALECDILNSDFGALVAAAKVSL